MNPIAELRRSFDGWSAIVRGDRVATSHFRCDALGLATAAGWLVVAVLLSVAAQSAVAGIPSIAQLALGLFAQAVTVGALWLVVTRAFGYLKVDVPATTLMVPVLYAMAYMFVVAIPLALIGPFAQLLAILGLAVLIFLAGRTLASMTTGVAAAFAALCLIVLVIVPNGLYIVFSLLPSPA